MPSDKVIREVNRLYVGECLSPGQRPVFVENWDGKAAARQSMRLCIVLLPSGNLCFEYRRCWLPGRKHS